MTFRGSLIWLAIFTVVTSIMSYLVYSTLRRSISGDTQPFAAIFTDAYGLRDGDDVRMAGVRVGRVEKVELTPDNLAKVSFKVQSDQKVLGNTAAGIVYQNIVGQRYVSLYLGGIGEPKPVPAGHVIPVEQTDPSFDVGIVLNGYEPLFSMIDPAVADQLTKGAVESLAGDPTAWTRMVEQSGQVTEALAGQDEVLGNVITGMDKLFGTLAEQNDNFDKTLAQTQQAVSGLNARRPELIDSMGSASRVIRQLDSISDDVYPAFKEMVDRQPGFTGHLLTIEPQLAFTGANLPLLLKGLARITNEGAYAQAYACDLNALGFFPGLGQVTDVVLAALTPGNVKMYSPRCRNMANG
jgi:phospholipid/cholesterol/gamma-HCH transport system substrate-binding protein